MIAEPSEHERVLDEARDAVGHELVERLDVVREPRDDRARPVALVEAERQPSEVAEEPQAQVGEDALAHPARQVRLAEAGRPADDAGGQERQHDPSEQRRGRRPAMPSSIASLARYGGASEAAVATSSAAAPATTRRR